MIKYQLNTNYIFIYSFMNIDKIRNIKIGRYSEEELFFNYVVDGMVIFKHIDYPDSIFWKKNNKIILEQDIKKMIIWVDDYIWDKYIVDFYYEYDEVEEVLNSNIEKILRWYGFTSCPKSMSFSDKWNYIKNENKCKNNSWYSWFRKIFFLQ